MSPEHSELPSDADLSSADSVAEIEDMIEQVDGALEVAAEKIESGRVYDAQNERVRCEWLRVLSHLIRTKRMIVDDRDRAEMVAEIKQLCEERTREQYR